MIHNITSYISAGLFNLRFILQYGDLTLTKLSLSLASILWSILLFLPSGSLLPVHDVYLRLDDIIPYDVWALLFLSHGIISAWAIIWVRSYRWLIIADSILGCILWTTSTMIMLLSFFPQTPPPAALSAEIVLTVFSWWFLFRTNYGRPT